MKHLHLRTSQVYIIMMFITAFASSTMFTTYSIYYVTKLGLNPFQLVLIGTVLELTVLVFEGITGVVADTYSRRISVIIGMFILGTGFIFEGSVLWILEWTSMLPMFTWMVITQLFFGIGFTFVSGADTAWIVDELGEDQVGALFMRTQHLSLIGTLLGIGVSVGLSMIAPNLTYIAGGIMYLAVGLFLILFMKETNFTPKPRAPHSSPIRTMAATWLSGLKVVRSQPLLIMLIAVSLFVGAASEGYDRLWGTFLISSIGLPEHWSFPMAVWFGMISAVSTVVGIVAVRIAEKRLDMSNRKAVTLAITLLFTGRITALIGLALAPSFSWAITAILVISVIELLSHPIYTTWLNMHIESHTRATVLSMISQSDALGQSAVGPAVGWVGTRFSLRSAFVLGGVLLTPILLLLVRTSIKKNPSTEVDTKA